MNAIELFGCSGGMAEGFRRAGIAFAHVFDWDPDACASYTANIGHKPVQMDVRDLVRMAAAGWSPGPVELLVADPPCTPWSKAGKRRGLDDERDMLRETCELIRHLRPAHFLIGNVPGLDEGPGLKALRSTIGSLARHGYCIDSARLDAAAYGVPQHRLRPFWFGHLDGDCIRWPEPTHGDPAECGHPHLPGVAPLRPWVTCREALAHLPLEEVGRPVKLRRRGCSSPQHGSVPERPARVVGTSNLSDGNALLMSEPARDRREHRHPGKKPRASSADAPAGVVTTRQNGDGNVLILPEHTLHGHDHDADKPARTVTGATRGHQAMLVNQRHEPNDMDAPSRTITAKVRGNGGQALRLPAMSDLPQGHRVGDPDRPAPTLSAKPGRSGVGESMLSWPWDRPGTTVTGGASLAPPGHHDESFALLSQPGAIVLSEKAAAILQGFPTGWAFVGKTKRSRWAQLGMAMPPPFAEAVARSVRRAMS